MATFEKLPDVHIDTTVEMAGRTWKLNVSDLADHWGICTQLDRNIWLDWHDVLRRPEEARMHMFPGAQENVGLSVKRMRMETWQAAILVFDSMMVDVKPPVSCSAMLALLSQKNIPRPINVALPTSNPSLIKLLRSFGIGHKN